MYKSIAFLTIFLVVGLFQAFAGNQQDLPLPHKVAGQHVYLLTKETVLQAKQLSKVNERLLADEKRYGLDINLVLFIAHSGERVEDMLSIKNMMRNTMGPIDGTRRVILFMFFGFEQNGNRDGAGLFYSFDGDGKTGIVRFNRDPQQMGDETTQEWNNILIIQKTELTLPLIECTLNHFEGGVVPLRSSLASN